MRTNILDIIAYRDKLERERREREHEEERRLPLYDYDTFEKNDRKHENITDEFTIKF